MFQGVPGPLVKYPSYIVMIVSEIHSLLCFSDSINECTITIYDIHVIIMMVMI